MPDSARLAYTPGPEYPEKVTPAIIEAWTVRWGEALRHCNADKKAIRLQFYGE